MPTFWLLARKDRTGPIEAHTDEVEARRRLDRLGDEYEIKPVVTAEPSTLRFTV